MATLISSVTMHFWWKPANDHLSLPRAPFVDSRKVAKWQFISSGRQLSLPRGERELQFFLANVMNCHLSLPGTIYLFQPQFPDFARIAIHLFRGGDHLSLPSVAIYLSRYCKIGYRRNFVRAENSPARGQVRSECH